MQHLEILQTRQSSRNKANVNVQFRGIMRRNSLPKDFIKESKTGNLLLARSLGLDINDTFKFTVWHTFDKKVFESNCKIDEKTGEIVYPTDWVKLFSLKPGEGNLVAEIARTTWVDPTATNLQTVINPTTKETLTFEGLPLYQYSTLVTSEGTEHIATFLGHEQPWFITVQEVDVASGTTDNAFA